MRRAWRALAIVAAAGSLGACNDYFSGPGIDTNPNTPVDAAADQLFVGIQGIGFYNLTGDINRVITVFTQQMSGTGRQWAGYSHYALTENDFGWDQFYYAGGLVDLYKLQERVQDDQVYLGITQVWEALLMSTVADVWGDIPYSEAAKGVAQPVLDNQMDVYAALQAKLSEAITNLSGSGLGPGPADLVYDGDKDLWLKAAHTLKARLYMHTAEVNSGDYQSALSETASGITSEDENWTTYQSTTTGEINHWYQFRIQRGTDIGAGKYLVDLMKARNDPRLTEYFSPGPAAPGGAIIGAPPNAEDNGTFAWLGPQRGLPEFRQPVITYDENALIRAEAQFKTGDQDGALATLNAYRATVGLGDLDLSGPQLYNAIMEEKYVALFQNVESWNDYKRTCYPNLPPADGSNYLPARLLYGTAERNANPNIPPPSAQPLRNANDPPTATDPLGNPCRGQGS